MSGDYTLTCASDALAWFNTLDTLTVSNGVTAPKATVLITA